MCHSQPHTSLRLIGLRVTIPWYEHDPLFGRIHCALLKANHEPIPDIGDASFGEVRPEAGSFHPRDYPLFSVLYNYCTAQYHQQELSADHVLATMPLLHCYWVCPCFFPSHVPPGIFPLLDMSSAFLNYRSLRALERVDMHCLFQLDTLLG